MRNHQFSSWPPGAFRAQIGRRSSVSRMRHTLPTARVAGMTGRRCLFGCAGVVALTIIFCEPAKPERNSASIANAAALDKACKAWTKTIHIGTRYRTGLGEDMAITRNTFLLGVYIWGRKKLLLEGDGRIVSATCG